MKPNEYLELSERTEKKFTKGLVLSQGQAEALHAALGVAGEAGEMAAALVASKNKSEFDHVNMGEEVGDYSWFLAQLSRQMNVPWNDIQASVDAGFAPEGSIGRIVLELNEIAGDIVDVVKKNIMYNKPIDEEALRRNTMKGWAAVGHMACVLDLEPARILEGNIAKLAKRFGDKYTDVAAQFRDLEAERESLNISFN